MGDWSWSLELIRNSAGSGLS